MDEVLLREQSCRSARSEIHDSLHSKEKRERERERERERDVEAIRSQLERSIKLNQRYSIHTCLARSGRHLDT